MVTLRLAAMVSPDVGVPALVVDAAGCTAHPDYGTRG
jgi:hypothetical protein